MINYIKYTVDGQTYSLIDNGDGTWSKEATAPIVSGNYSMIFEISENGIVTYTDSSDSRYQIYLNIIEAIEKLVDLKVYLPLYMRDVFEINLIMESENEAFDQLYTDIASVKANMFIETASNEKITQLENFLQIKGIGTLEQRKNYLLSLFRKGNKLSEGRIKDIVRTIIGADCVVAFYGADELNNPSLGYGLIYLQVLSPDGSIDYRYEDIARSISPLIPGHLKLLVVKYFALWQDINDNFLDWDAVKGFSNWGAVKNYIPPQA